MQADYKSDLSLSLSHEPSHGIQLTNLPEDGNHTKAAGGRWKRENHTRRHTRRVLAQSSGWSVKADPSLWSMVLRFWLGMLRSGAVRRRVANIWGERAPSPHTHRMHHFKNQPPSLTSAPPPENPRTTHKAPPHKGTAWYRKAALSYYYYYYYDDDYKW